MAEYSRAKLETLENAVLTKSPQEVSEIFKNYGELLNTARALALACRFRGLKYVKALVEGGASFAYIRPLENYGYYTIYYWLAPLEMNGALRKAAFLDVRDGLFTDTVRNTSIRREEIKNFIVLPIEQRAEITRYLCENKERVKLDIDELLYYSIISGSKKITTVLKEYGAKISEVRTRELTDTGRGFQWTEFCYMTDELGEKEFIENIGNLVKELNGKTLRYSDSIFWGNYNPNYKVTRLYNPKFFKFILDNFNQKKMNKKQFMTGAIDENNVECLKICAEIGWLKMPNKRDEMIKYATDNNKTECTAFLLEYKNRTADLRAEQKKAERKMMRELNADPNSVTELKKIWGFEKREDGAVVITRYKGKRTEIDVPEKIGNMVVREIGDYAFSAEAPRLRTEQIGLRQNITEIILPKTIEAIGKNAFSCCTHLKNLNIPQGVKKIGDSAFYDCINITEMPIPESVQQIGANAFSCCQRLKVINLPQGIDAIEEFTFGSCEALINITIPDTVRKIGKWAFQRCLSFEEITVPEGVEEIGEKAFAYCTKLKSLKLPKSVTKIKNYKYKSDPPQSIVFDDKNVTVTVPIKSYSEKYCKRNNIPYITKEEG